MLGLEQHPALLTADHMHRLHVERRFQQAACACGGQSSRLDDSLESDTPLMGLMC